jgi:adenylate cyclase
MSQNPDKNLMVENVWRSYLTTGLSANIRRQRRLFKWLPGPPRCKNCFAPFKGLGGTFVKLVFGKQPSNLNPQLCNICEQFASQYQGGAEVVLSLLFADVRGSTQLAEQMSALEFSQLINRFFTVATQVFVDSDALIDKIIGDQAAGMYVPGFAGPAHAQRALEAAQAILQATGHARPEGPWIPLGVGVHTGIAYVGSVGKADGPRDITVLGDTANTAARLSSAAGQGEILISETAYQAAGLNLDHLEKRQLALKGKSQPISVYVLSSKPT